MSDGCKPYAREEVLIEQFGEMLDRITMAEPMYCGVTNALRESFADVNAITTRQSLAFRRNASGCVSE